MTEKYQPTSQHVTWIQLGTLFSYLIWRDLITPSVTQQGISITWCHVILFSRKRARKYCHSYCRVLRGNATNNVWGLNLTFGLLEYLPGRITVSRFTILQHINFHLTLLSSVFFALHWTDFYSRLMLHCRLIWPFADWFYPSLFVSSVSHSHKLILCRLEREHPVEPFNFLFSDATAASIFDAAESHS
jgi:hypothetical protein